MRTTSESGMNIFELLFFVVNVLLGLVLARWSLVHFGWIGGILGFVAGFAIIPVAFLLVDMCRRLVKK